MKRILASTLILAAVSGFGLVGCGETAKEQVKETVTTPGGSTSTTTGTEVKSTGSNPPANSAGETAKTPK
jgi:hypothetical protein